MWSQSPKSGGTLSLNWHGKGRELSVMLLQLSMNGLISSMNVLISSMNVQGGAKKMPTRKWVGGAGT